MQRKTEYLKGARLIANFNRAALATVAAIAIGLWAPGLAKASLIAENEPNNSGATAQNVNGNFSLDFHADINDSLNANTSLTIPHVSIRATGDGQTYDFYRFTHGGGTMILDIDSTPTGNFGSNADTEIGLWDGAGNLIISNDDFPVDPGSIANPGNGCLFGGSCNSFIQIAQAAGDYIVGVCRFSCTFGNGFLISGDALTAEGFYTLHISSEGAQVPEPSAMLLLASGLAGLMGYRRRHRQN